jgi:hypothetical protein
MQDLALAWREILQRVVRGARWLGCAECLEHEGRQARDALDVIIRRRLRDVPEIRQLSARRTCDTESVTR